MQFRTWYELFFGEVEEVVKHKQALVPEEPDTQTTNISQMKAKMLPYMHHNGPTTESLE